MVSDRILQKTYRVFIERPVDTASFDFVARTDQTSHLTASRKTLLHRLEPVLVASARFIVGGSERLERSDD